MTVSADSSSLSGHRVDDSATREHVELWTKCCLEGTTWSVCWDGVPHQTSGEDDVFSVSGRS